MREIRAAARGVLRVWWRRRRLAPCHATLDRSAPCAPSCRGRAVRGAQGHGAGRNGRAVLIHMDAVVAAASAGQLALGDHLLGGGGGRGPPPGGGGGPGVRAGTRVRKHEDRLGGEREDTASRGRQRECLGAVAAQHAPRAGRRPVACVCVCVCVHACARVCAALRWISQQARSTNALVGCAQWQGLCPSRSPWASSAAWPAPRA